MLLGEPGTPWVVPNQVSLDIWSCVLYVRNRNSFRRVSVWMKLSKCNFFYLHFANILEVGHNPDMCWKIMLKRQLNLHELKMSKMCLVQEIVQNQEVFHFHQGPGTLDPTTEVLRWPTAAMMEPVEPSHVKATEPGQENQVAQVASCSVVFLQWTDVWILKRKRNKYRWQMHVVILFLSIEQDWFFFLFLSPSSQTLHTYFAS